MSDRAPKPKDVIEALWELAGSGSDTSARSESVSDAIGGQRNTRNDPPATVPPSRAFEGALQRYRALVIEGEEVGADKETYRRWLWRYVSAYLEVLRLYDEALAAPPPGESVEGAVVKTSRSHWTSVWRSTVEYPGAPWPTGTRVRVTRI